MRIHPSGGRLAVSMALIFAASCTPKPPERPGRIMEVHELSRASTQPEPRTVLVRGIVDGPLTESGYLLIDEQQPCAWPPALARIDIAEASPGAPPDVAAFWKAVNQTGPGTQKLHVVFEADPVYLKHTDGRWWLTDFKVRRVVRQALGPPLSCAEARRKR
jgi:hypothetical protein